MENRPDLLTGLDFYLTAFKDLMNDRPVTMGGMAPIPWSVIDRWAQRYNLNEEQFETLVHHIRAMEAALYEHENKKGKSK